MIKNVSFGGRFGAPPGGRRQPPLPPLPPHPPADAVPDPVLSVAPLNVEVLRRILARVREMR